MFKQKDYLTVGKYAEAASLYAINAEVGGAINKVDTVYYYYAAIASQNAKDWDKYS